MNKEEKIYELYSLIKLYGFKEIKKTKCLDGKYKLVAQQIYYFADGNPNCSRVQLVNAIQKIFFNILRFSIDESYAVVIAMFVQDLLKI